MPSRTSVDAEDGGDGVAAVEEPTDTPKPGNQQRVHFQTPEANVIARGSSPSKAALTINSQSAGENHCYARQHNSRFLNGAAAKASEEHIKI
jgi:hypothetical protein